MPTTTPLTIRWVHASAYYNEPLTGWLRANGRYFYFELAEPQSYRVYEMPRDVTLAHLRHARLFRHVVGWLWDWKPGARTHSLERGPRDGYKAFYEAPAPAPVLPDAVGRLVGTSDLRTIVPHHA